MEVYDADCDVGGVLYQEYVETCEGGVVEFAHAVLPYFLHSLCIYSLYVATNKNTNVVAGAIILYRQQPKRSSRMN